MEEEEFEPNDEDRAFFEEHGQFLTFLDRMDTSELSLYVSLPSSYLA